MIPGINKDIPVGFFIYCNRNSSKSINNSFDCKVSPVSVRRIDYDYMISKTGAVSSLKSKRVLLLGCGSIGGYVAANLCQSGICTIDILDSDILSVDNVHRHILGFSDATTFNYKAELMRKYLENQYPFIEVDSMNYVKRDVREVIKNADVLKGYDLIVSALGEPTINLEINRILKEKQIQTPFIICFNEPYSIGGHIIAVNIGHGGCLQCLYTDLESNEIIPYRASFVKENQNFSKSLSGCAGTYVEYTSLDSQQTALLTCRLCLEVLKHEIDTSTIISWYGNSNSLKENGFFTSDYYDNIVLSGKYNGIVRKTFEKNGECSVC